MDKSLDNQIICLIGLHHVFFKLVFQWIFYSVGCCYLVWRLLVVFPIIYSKRYRIQRDHLWNSLIAAFCSIIHKKYLFWKKYWNYFYIFPCFLFFIIFLLYHIHYHLFYLSFYVYDPDPLWYNLILTFYILKIKKIKFFFNL